MKLPLTNRNKWLTLTLSVSLALNLFFLGVVAARLVRGPGHHGPGMSMGREGGARSGGPGGAPRPMDMVKDLVRVMGGRDDPRVASIWRERRGHLHERTAELNAANQALTRALTAENYSEQAVRDVLLRLNTHTRSAQEHAQGAVIKLSAQLSPEERRQLKRLLEKRDSSHKLR